MMMFTYEMNLFCSRRTRKMARRCTLEYEIRLMMDSCMSSAYVGNHGGELIAHKVLQSGFFHPTIFQRCCRLCETL